MLSDRATDAPGAAAPTALSGRTLLWTGLALVAAGVMLDLGALCAIYARCEVSESPTLLLAGRLVQAALFAAGIAVARGGRPGVGAYPLRPVCGAAAALLGMQVAALLFWRSRGVVEVLLAGAVAALLLLAVHRAAAALLPVLGVRRPLPGVAGPLLAIAALALTTAAAEGLLDKIARRTPRPVTAAPLRLTMPDELGRRDAQVPGARAAWWWQGQLHVFDDAGLRRATPLPPKTPGVFRVIAVGDSLTYGYGVAEQEAWPSVLERALAAEYRAEVLNLGVCGVQSEEVLGNLHRYLPLLEPDLVLYGVCLNDFLPAGRGVYSNNRAWPVAFPGSSHLEGGTRVGALVAERYDRLLMRVGVRADFLSDILRDFNDYQRRFARDAAEMQRAVAARGLPPPVALVLTQTPRTAGPGARITAVAERLLRAAGITVVAADYVRAHDGRELTVSHWEAHPNAEAHRIFAAEFLAAVRRDPRLAAFRREAPPAAR